MARLANLNKMRVLRLLAFLWIFYYGFHHPRLPLSQEEHATRGIVVVSIITLATILQSRSTRSPYLYAACACSWVSLLAFFLGYPAIELASSYIVPALFVIATFQDVR